MKKILLGLALLTASLTFGCAFADDHMSQSDSNSAHQMKPTDAMIKADGDLSPTKCDDQKLKDANCQDTCMIFQQCVMKCASQYDPSKASEKQDYEQCKNKNCKDAALDVASCVLKSQGIHLDIKKLSNMKNHPMDMK